MMMLRLGDFRPDITFVYSFVIQLSLEHVTDVGVVQGIVVPASSQCMSDLHTFGVSEGGWFLSVNLSSPAGAALVWKCAERGVEEPSSQNSTSPSALREPRLTRLPFSFIRSSIVTDLSEKICSPLATWLRRSLPRQTFRWSLIRCLFLQSGHEIRMVPLWYPCFDSLCEERVLQTLQVNVSS